MTNGLINYQYSAIADGVHQMQTVNQNIQQQVSDLGRQVIVLHHLERTDLGITM